VMCVKFRRTVQADVLAAIGMKYEILSRDTTFQRSGFCAG
jgi:hypothetical protein